MEAREIERCIDEFGADVYRFCLKLCMNREDAEDLYQQTFLQALEREAALEWERNPRAFFFAMKLASFLCRFFSTGTVQSLENAYPVGKFLLY